MPVGQGGPVQRYRLEVRRFEESLFHARHHASKHRRTRGEVELERIDVVDPPFTVVEVHQVEADSAVARTGDGDVPAPVGQAPQARLDVPAAEHAHAVFARAFLTRAQEDERVAMVVYASGCIRWLIAPPDAPGPPPLGGLPMSGRWPK